MSSTGASSKDVITKSVNYVILNPFYQHTKFSSGIDHYCRSAYDSLSQIDSLAPLLINREPGESALSFVRRARRIVTELCDENDLVEVPDSKGYSLGMLGRYRTHVRLHCPLTVARAYDGQPRNKRIYYQEQLALSRAELISSPSLLMQEATCRFFKLRAPVCLYPNPPPCQPFAGGDRDIDVLLFGRAQKLKGSDYIHELIQKFDARWTVVVAGVGFEGMRLPERVDIKGPQDQDQKLDLMRRARCVILLSEFESFSMVGAEALLSGANLVGWPEVGLREWLPLSDDSPARWVDERNLDLMVETVDELLLFKAPDFAYALYESLQKSFMDSIQRLISSTNSKAP